MTGTIANAMPAWVPAFFGGSNGLTWSDIQGGRAPDGWGPEVLSWLEILDRDEDGVALLPFLDTSGAVVWFGVARSERAGRRLGEDITGFIGATYGGFDGRPYMPDVSDTPGTILSAALPAPMYRIAPDARGRSTVRRAIGIYRSLLERRPTARRLSARSVGALRTRFDRALLAGNEEEASRLYDEILATGRLSLENRHYLRVRLLAGLGRWTELAAEARLLRALADLTLPPQVRAELLDALYRTHIDPVEDPRDAGAALEEFRLKIAPFGRLFAMRQGLRQPRVVKAFLLNALLRAQPQRDELDELLALLPESPIDAGFSAALRGLVNAQVPEQAHASASAADSAFDDLEFDHALRLYSTIPPSRKSIARMIHCAHTIGTADAAHIALGALTASPEIETTLPQSVRSIVEVLRYQTASISVAAEPASDASSAMQLGSWLDWTTWVAAGAQADEASRLVEQQSCNWEVGTYLHYDAASALAHALEDAALTSPEIIQGAFPSLYQAFVGETEEVQAPLSPIYRALLSAVVPEGTTSCFIDSRTQALLPQILERISPGKRNCLYMGSGFYEGGDGQGQLPRVPHQIVTSLRDAGLLTRNADIDLYVDPDNCQAIAGAIEAIRAAKWTVRRPGQGLFRGAPRSLHAKFIFGAHFSRNSNRCSDSWLYLGSGNMTHPGLLLAGSRGGNLEAGLVLAPEELLWCHEKQSTQIDIRSVLPLDWESPELLSESVSFGSEMLERPPAFVVPPVPYLSWAALSEQDGRLAVPSGTTALFDVIGPSGEPCQKDSLGIVWTGVRPLEVTVTWNFLGQQWRDRIAVIDEYGRIAASALRPVALEEAWSLLADFPMPPTDDLSGEEDLPIAGVEDGSKKIAGKTSKPGTYAIRKMMELIERIAARQTTLSPGDWTAWCVRLGQTLEQAKDDCDLASFKALKLNPLSALRASPFRPDFAIDLNSSAGALYDSMLDRLEASWQVAGSAKIGI